jgi:membrane carboxypeptidase/penicillin-binding protein PbpC
MGITSLDGRDLGPSMTVGGVDLELLDMVYGYTVFPNLGVLKGIESTVARPEGNRTTDPVAILRVEDRDGNILYPKVDDQPVDHPLLQEVQVAPAQNAYMINSILSDPNAHCLTYGCGGLTIPGRPIGMKTGTSEPYEQIGFIGETWTFGYTPQLVFGTWFGNADNKPMVNISSYYVSARTTRDFMIAYHENLPVEQFVRPDGLVETSVCVPSGLKPTPACPETSPKDLFAADAVPTKDDDWWTSARVDTRTGKLASDLTPLEFVEVRRFLKLPDGLSDFARDQALEWARSLETDVGDAPTETTDESDLPGVITSPANAEPVRGVVTITGRAASADFESYRLEYHNDQGGGDWLLIAQGVTEVNGVLGRWDSSALEPGLYTIRLVVDAERGETVSRVQVLVLGPEAPTAPEPTPAGGAGRGPPLALLRLWRHA